MSDTSPPVAPPMVSSGTMHQPLYVRITHWINAAAIIVMIGSGWQIYNASPLFAFTFPGSLTIGGWLGGALLWHFAAMWVFMVNGLVYLLLALASGRFARVLLPIRPREVAETLRAAVHGKLRHDGAGYNAAQKLFYVGVILVGLLVVASGLAIWKPVQLQPLTAFFGGYDVARIVHFCAMALIVAFLVVHVVMALLVPRTIRAMIIGR